MEHLWNPEQDHELEDWMAVSRTDEAARSRRRTAAWMEHGPVDASLTGVLVDLAERGAEVVVTLSGGRIHRGVVLEVASTWVLIRTGSGDRVVIRLRCAESIDCTGLPNSFGERSASTTMGFVATLDQLVDIGATITMRTAHQTTRGELRLLGEEIAIVAIDAMTMRYVSMEAVDEVTIAGGSARS